jgi:hypothetical protein
LKGLRSGWEEDYKLWYRGRFNIEPPGIVSFSDPATSETVHRFKMGYDGHLRPAKALVMLLGAMKGTLTPEMFYRVEIRGEGRPAGAKVSYMSRVSDVLSDPDLGELLRKDNILEVRLSGGEKSPNRGWMDKAGWIVANMLADPTFDMGSESDRSAEVLGRMIRLL